MAVFAQGVDTSSTETKVCGCRADAWGWRQSTRRVEVVQAGLRARAAPHHPAATLAPTTALRAGHGADPQRGGAGELQPQRGAAHRGDHQEHRGWVAWHGGAYTTAGLPRAGVQARRCVLGAGARTAQASSWAPPAPRALAHPSAPPAASRAARRQRRARGGGPPGLWRDGAALYREARHDGRQNPIQVRAAPLLPRHGCVHMQACRPACLECRPAAARPALALSWLRLESAQCRRRRHPRSRCAAAPCAPALPRPQARPRWSSCRRRRRTSWGLLGSCL